MPWENRPKEIAQLEQRGRWALEHLDPPLPPDSGQSFALGLRLWRYPAFGAWSAWGVFESVRRPSGRAEPIGMVVHEVTWDCPHDMARFADPLEGVRQGFSAPPTIQTRAGELPRGDFVEWQREMARISIPIVGIEAAIGLDGEWFGFESFDEFLPIHLEWWGDGPVGWRQFTRGIDRLRQRLLDCLS